MEKDRENIGDATRRPANDTIAGTGPGIPDDALAPGEDQLPTPPTDEEVERIAKALHAPIGAKSDDTLPLEGE